MQTLHACERVSGQVWLDEAGSLVGGGVRFRHLGDLEPRRALRRRLRCRPFRWYLENIFPDHDPLPAGFRWMAPPQRESAVATGVVALRETSERGAGVGGSDEAHGSRLANGTVRLQTAYSHLPVRTRGGGHGDSSAT